MAETQDEKNPHCPACKKEMENNSLQTFYACNNQKCNFAGIERVYWVWDKE